MKRQARPTHSGRVLSRGVKNLLRLFVGRPRPIRVPAVSISERNRNRSPEPTSQPANLQTRLDCAYREPKPTPRPRPESRLLPAWNFDPVLLSRTNPASESLDHRDQA